MQNNFFSFLLGLVFLSATLCSSFANAGEKIIDFQTGLQGNYRFDELNWNIAGDLDGQNPNILSELSWTDLETYQLEWNGKLVSGNNEFPVPMKLRWSIGYGFIVEGDNQESDYSADNRTSEDSRSNNSGDKGSMVDLSIGYGPHFFLTESKTASLSLLLGFAYREQNLTMADGNRTIDTVFNNIGPYDGLDSTYETEWISGWLGLDFEWKIFSPLTLSMFSEFHMANYKAEADWNLDTDLVHPVSFEHWGDEDYDMSDGYGVVAGANLDLQFSKSWILSLGGRYYDFRIKDGIQRTYYSAGYTVDTQLNEVGWQSWSGTIGLVYRFR